MGLTTDPQDPRLSYGIDPPGTVHHQAAMYLVPSEEERARGFVRPVRRTYIHVGMEGEGHPRGCGAATTMGVALAETYARDPHFYGATFCCHCQRHPAVAEFIWEDGERVGS